MTTWKHLIIGCALILPAMSALAAPSGLLDIYQQAQKGDPDFGAAVANYQAGLKNQDIGLAGLLPSVSASVSSTRNRYGLETTALPWADYNFTSRVQTIQLTQSIFDWEKISAYNEASAFTELAKAVFAEAQADLIVRVAQGYFGYLLASDNLEMAEAQKNALSQQRIQAEKLYKSGVGTITDVEETKARYEIAEAQLLAASGTLDVRRRELEKMTGAMPGDIRRITGSFEMALPEPLNVTAWLESAARQNLKVISQQLNLRVAEIQADKGWAGHLPSLSLVASRQKGSAPNYFTNSDSSSRVGLQLSVPLYEGGKVTGMNEQAFFRKEKARHELESAVRDSRIKVSQAYLGVVNGIAQVKALEQAVKSGETTLQGMKVGQRTGFRTNTDVLNAQQQLFVTQRDLQQQRYTYLLSRLQLQAETGSLNDQSVALIDSIISQPK